MVTERDIFLDFLEKRNLKLTSQREEILKHFLKTNRHISTEDLYTIIKKKDPNIGQATVFRTLKLLCQAGIAGEVDLGDKRTRYEHKYGHQHHDHLVCIKCGKSIEVSDPKIEKLQEELCEKKGFISKTHKMDIFGVCRNCRTK